MALNRLQNQLERIYEVRIEHRVEDFVCSDPRLLAALEPQAAAGSAREQLLVHKDDEGLNLSLYLDAAVLERLGDVAMPDSDIDSWCVALEGVSHFLYLVWSASHERQVSLLELELQAEVDKYVALTCAVAARHGARLPAGLRRVLFDAAHFDPRLRGAELARYRDAHRYAARYCAELERRHGGDGGLDRMLCELRRFYRLDQAGKLRRIEEL